MAIKKSTKTLERSCLNAANKHIYILQKRVQYLPPALLDELYEIRYKNRSPINAFLTPGRRKLELNPKSEEIWKKIKRITVCRNLRHLNISSTKIKVHKIQLLVENNPNLEILHLEDTKCSNRVLNSIRINCQKLTLLNISSCVNVNDKGIRNLCKDNNMKISTLNVNGTSVSIYGCLFALNNLHCLIDISHERIMEMIEAPENSHKLLSSTIQTANFPPIGSVDHLRRLSIAFPNLSKLKILVDVSQDQILYPFVTFLKLDKLTFKVHGLFTRIDTFQIRIRPVIHHLNNLTNLKIWDVPKVDVALIGRSCPKLRRLVIGLEGATEEESLNEPCQHILFENLEELKVVEDGDERVPQEMELLLRNCYDIKSLIVRDSSVFSDEFFETLLGWNPMKYLERISLEDCPEITTGFLKRLMKMDNLLRNMQLYRCYDVNVGDLVKFADVQCLDIEITSNPHN